MPLQSGAPGQQRYLGLGEGGLDKFLTACSVVVAIVVVLLGVHVLVLWMFEWLLVCMLALSVV